MERQTLLQQQTGSPWRLKLGVTIFILGFLSPLLIPVVKAMQMPTAWKVVISGALAVGVPEVFAIVAVAIMGKDGFNIMKASIFKLIKRYGPPDAVGISMAFTTGINRGLKKPMIKMATPSFNRQGEPLCC